MLKDNESLDKISRFTGLSQDEIMKLKINYKSRFLFLTISDTQAVCLKSIPWLR